MSDIPSLLKKNSTYIRTIDEYSEEFIFEIVQKLIATEEFWEIAIEDTSLIPEKTYMCFFAFFKHNFVSAYQRP